MNANYSEPLSLISVHRLTKKYQRRIIFEDISTLFQEGCFYVLCGENGSGKSTFLKCIMGLVRYDGTINVVKHRKIGYAPEQYVMPEWMTVYQFLDTLGRLSNNKKKQYTLDYYLDYFDLLPYKHQRIGVLSNGGKQKVNVIQALMDEPDILILDEPLRALDETSKEKMVAILLTRSSPKCTIISTHLLDWFESIPKTVLSFPIDVRTT